MPVAVNAAMTTGVPPRSVMTFSTSTAVELACVDPHSATSSSSSASPEPSLDHVEQEAEHERDADDDGEGTP